jgi:hypothetical protein
MADQPRGRVDQFFVVEDFAMTIFLYQTIEQVSRKNLVFVLRSPCPVAKPEGGESL